MRRATILVVVLLAACSSSAKTASAPAPTTPTTVPAACTPARPAPRVQVSYTFANRGYRLAMPRDYDGSRAFPLVLLFHGWNSDKEAFDAETSFDRLGSARGYIVVTPDGSGTPRSWNLFNPAATNDFGYIDKLVVHLANELCIDRARIYATGHSAGSAFAGFLVCNKPSRYAAVAMVSATVPSSCPPSIAESVLGIHGTADPAVLYDGGKGVGQSVAIPPIKETIAAYAKRASCQATPTTDRPAPGVVRLRYTGCKQSKAVALVTIEKGGHPWPGGLQATSDPKAVPGARFSASRAILDFFDGLAR